MDFYGSQQTINLLEDGSARNLTLSSNINYITPEGTTVETAVDADVNITVN